MSFAGHGKWCGPGWSAGQYKDAKDLTEEDKLVPADDELDQACKEHDIGIAEGDPEANKKFYEKAYAANWYGVGMAAIVALAGPPTHSYLRGNENMKTKEEKRAEIKQRAREKQQKQERIWDAESTDIAMENVRKRKASQEILGPQKRIPYEEEEETKGDEFPVINAEDAIHATIDEEMNQNLREVAVNAGGDMITPQMVPRGRDPDMTREDRPLRGVRPQRSLTNLLNQADNDQIMEDFQPMALRSAGGGEAGGTGTSNNKETAVKYNSRSEMGIFTETRTAYLPITVYFSINRTDITLPVPLRFRVDWPFDIFKENTLEEQSLRIAYNEGTIRQKGLSNDMAKSGNRNTGVTGITTTAATFNTVGASGRDPAINQGQLFPFPTTVVGATAAVQGTALIAGKSSSGAINDARCIPAYRKWYAKMYQYAHCMETDWKVTYSSGDSNEEFQNVRVYEGIDCVSTGNTDRIPVDCELGTVDHWPYLKKHDLKQRTENNSRMDYTISGKWVPGRQHPMKMIPNTEEIKTWTKLGDTDFLDRNPAAYREDITLLHYSHPDSNNQAGFYNVRVDLRYKIQFKDLTNNLRWPKANVTAVSLSNLDCIQVPYPTQSTGVAANPERVLCDGVANPR